MSAKTLAERKELTVHQSELLMAAVIIARSTSFVISKLTVAAMSPFNILAVRFLSAFVILLLLFHRQMKRCTGKIFRNGVVLGIVYSFVMGFEMTGIQYAETSLASLIENSAFILVPVLEILFLHQFPKRSVTIGMVLAFCGLLILNFSPGVKINFGCIYLFAAMAFYALAIFLTAIFAKEGEPLLVGIVQIGTMGVLSLLCSLLLEDFRIPSSGREWVMILFLAVVCSVFGFTLQPVAQRGLEADRAGMFSVLNPLAAIIWGNLILSEPITPTKITGAVFIVVGILFPILFKR